MFAFIPYIIIVTESMSFGKYIKARVHVTVITAPTIDSFPISRPNNSNRKIAFEIKNSE